ncbi:MAG: hypothetical protein HC842_00190 [Cytophagales bacterium]|nr:hypothetical protein [Cytophagales bacterium]
MKQWKLLGLLLFVATLPMQAQITVTNPGAETGSISPWTGTGLINSNGGNKVYEGTKSFLLKRNENTLEQVISGLSPNTTYTLKAYVFVDGSDATQAQIGAKNYGGTEVSASGNPQTFTQLAVDFTTGSTNTSATIFMRHNVGGFKWIYVDKVEVIGFADTQAPSVPTGLAASNLTYNSLTLNWNSSTDNVGVSTYEVFRNGSSIGTTSATSLAVTSLVEQTAYSFTVRARDAAGNNSAQSSVLSVTTLAAPDMQAPTVPSGLVASNLTTTSITLSWAASSDNVGVTAYRIFRDGSSIGTTANTSFSVTGLTASTAYSFTVNASDAAGNVSAQSANLSVTTQSSGGSGGIISVANSGAESGTISPWTGSGLVSSTGSKVFEGGYAFLLKRNENLLEQTITGLLPSTAYTLEAYVFVDGVDATAIQLGARNFGGSEVTVASSSQSYVQVMVNFTTGASNTSAVIFLRHNQAGWKWAYADKIELSGGGGPPPSIRKLLPPQVVWLVPMWVLLHLT